MKRILHWGGWSRNVGDLAIQSATATLLQSQLGPVQIDYFNSDLLYMCSNAPAPLLDRHMVSHLNDYYDLVIVGPGGQIMSRTDSQTKSGWQFNISNDDLKYLEVPVVVWSIGYNKYRYEIDFLTKAAPSLKLLFKQAKLFSVRNRGTAKALKDLINLDVNRIVPDPALFVNANPLFLDTVWDEGVNVIAVNLAGDAMTKRFGDSDSESTFYKGLCWTLRRLSVCLDDKCVILYIPHVTQYDMAPLDKLRSEMRGVIPIYSLHELVPSLYPESSLTLPFIVGAYRKAKVCFGMRGHANIIAYGQGVPCYGIGGSPKVEYFFNEMSGLTPLGGDYNIDAEMVYRQAFVNGHETHTKMLECKHRLDEVEHEFMRDIGKI